MSPVIIIIIVTIPENNSFFSHFQLTPANKLFCFRLTYRFARIFAL